MAQPAPAAEPKIVVQAISEAGIDVAAWSPDGRFIWTASGLARELLLWDAARGIIIDRLRLPSPPGAVADFMRLTSMTMAPDGRTLRIDGQVLSTERENGIGARGYSVETASRRISIVPSILPVSAETANWQQSMLAWNDALKTVYGQGSEEARAAAARLLPPLPRSPDGRTQMLRGDTGFALRGPDGAVRYTQINELHGSISDADLSTDDRYLAVLTLNDETVGNETGFLHSLQLLDLVTGQMQQSAKVPAGINRLAWLDRERIALFEHDMGDDPRIGNAPAGKLLDIRIVNAATGAVIAQPEGRCFMAALPDGRMLGAGLANCRKDVGTDKTLQILINGQWRSYGNHLLPPDAHVRTLAVAPAGDRFAYALRLANGQLRIHVADIAAGRLGPWIDLAADTLIVTRISFSPDGRVLWIGGDGGMAEWRLPVTAAQGKPLYRQFPGLVLMPQRMKSDGRRLLVGGQFEERIKLINLASGQSAGDINFPGAAAFGYMRTRPALWAASLTEGFRFWDRRSGAVLATVRLLPGGRFVAVAPDGRYDTNMGPDSESFRWLISDKPWQSLAPQTLMRDYYEPRLIAKLMDCTSAGNCATALHKVPPVAGLNRQLPVVAVKAVRFIGRGKAEVVVEASETRNAETGLSSGVYDTKLLMNNREIARVPDVMAQQLAKLDLETWRSINFNPPVDASGIRRWALTVPIPTDGKPIEFSAYSFNADRVKSDTGRLKWQPPAQRPRPRRAYVITIGVNDYDERRLKLDFAVPDADLIGRRLATIPGYEVRHINLTSTPTRRVTVDDISNVMMLLTIGPMPPVLDQLRAAGHDGSALDEATPDDVVIISFSGHGFADAAGAFALLTSEARWGALDKEPDPSSVLSGQRLTSWLRYLKAGEVAFIIDACHSGAAVNTPDFKPGPMGDPGLGQLAFDKGMRILAATQGDDVALENPNLAHGLLSAALGEGLTATGGPADMDHDGKIPLDEWLRYAVARLPSLHEEVRRGGGPVIARGVRLVLRGSNEPPPVQEPSLFDFTNTTSPVLLRGQP